MVPKRRILRSPGTMSAWTSARVPAWVVVISFTTSVSGARSGMSTLAGAPCVVAGRIRIENSLSLSVSADMIVRVPGRNRPEMTQRSKGMKVSSPITSPTRLTPLAATASASWDRQSRVQSARSESMASPRPISATSGAPWAWRSRRTCVPGLGNVPRAMASNTDVVTKTLVFEAGWNRSKLLIEAMAWPCLSSTSSPQRVPSKAGV
jgi:hypothetical protein